MKTKVEKFIAVNRLIEAGDRVIAAVSGGADSVCLLSILSWMSGKIGFSIRAIHVHHGLRGEEADRDAEFTRAFCESRGIPVCILYADVRGYAESRGCSEEEAGRLVRYELLEKEADAWERKEPGKSVKIAVAHHGDDSTETILYNLFRGTGLLGLGGIRPVRGRIIRPLLCVEREEILTYLKENALDYCQDSTNQSMLYTRNRIRNEILPLIEEKVNPRAGEHIRQAGERIRQADEFIRKAAAEWMESREIRMLEENGREKFFLLPEELEEEPEILQAYILQDILAELTGTRRDLTARHVERLQDLLAGTVGRRADLSDGVCAVREYHALRLIRRDREYVETIAEPAAPKVEFTVFPREKNSEFPKNQYTKWFDYDKIKKILSVRTRRTGDFITLAGGGKKSVKAYMIDEKIPASLRDSVFLLADGSHVLWIIGYRISEYYKIGPQTKTILQAQINGGEYHGR